MKEKLGQIMFRVGLIFAMLMFIAALISIIVWAWVSFPMWKFIATFVPLAFVGLVIMLLGVAL